MSILSLFSISFIASFLLIPLYCRLVKKSSLLALPDKRSSHLTPTPSGGGIVFFCIFLLVSVFNNNFWQLTCLPLAFVGFFDDRSNLSPKVRYFFQLLTMLLIVIFCGQNYFLSGEYINLYLVLRLIMIFFIGTAIINLINFMDGLDGLVGLSMTIVFITLSIALSINNLWSLVGALIGFLIWNFQSSKIFMGDSGSTSISAIFIFLSLQSGQFVDSFKIVLLLSPLLLDSSICIFRRFVNGQNIFSPHKLHLYQRLNQAGWSHIKVALIYGLGTLSMCLAYLFFNFSLMFLLVLIELLIGFYLEINYSKSFQSILRNKNL